MITLVSPIFAGGATAIPLLVWRFRSPHHFRSKSETRASVLEGSQKRLQRRPPQRPGSGRPEYPVPVAAESWQRNIFGPAARANERLGHLARQVRREKRVIGRIEPQRRNAGSRAIARGRLDQALRHAVADLRMPAASTAGEI